MNSYMINPYFGMDFPWEQKEFSFLKSEDMQKFHRQLPGYRETDLRRLPKIEEKLRLKSVFVKDESTRFGVKAFKPLGASYAIYRCLKSRYQEKYGKDLAMQDFFSPAMSEDFGKITFCAATDGNHGKAVAWTANRLGQKAIIYMPADTAQSRIDAITAENAGVELVKGTFDDCVAKCDADARKNGWQVIADTAYEGYEEIPRYIVLGYMTIFFEIDQTMWLSAPEAGETADPGFDLLILQAGVGGLAAAGAAYYRMRYRNAALKILVVEPESSDCFLESVKCGNIAVAKGAQDSIMAGLNCGLPSRTAWPVLKSAANAFMAIDDQYALEAMRVYYHDNVTSGESGAAGLAGLLALFDKKNEKLFAPLLKELNLGPHSRVMLINTEGDTDPVHYKQVIEKA